MVDTMNRMYGPVEISVQLKLKLYFISLGRIIFLGTFAYAVYAPLLNYA